MVLFQFPVSIKFTTKNKEAKAVRLEGNWDHVADVLNAFKEYPKAIEFRHEKSLKGMAKKVEREPSRRQAKKVIAATNNHYKGQAAVNAIDLSASSE